MNLRPPGGGSSFWRVAQGTVWQDSGNDRRAGCRHDTCSVGTAVVPDMYLYTHSIILSKHEDYLLILLWILYRYMWFPRIRIEFDFYWFCISYQVKSELDCLILLLLIIILIHFY